MHPRNIKKKQFVYRKHQIEGIDYFYTHAPVVSWKPVRLLLIILMMKERFIKKFDYTLVFVHEILDKNNNIYVEITYLFREDS